MKNFTVKLDAPQLNDITHEDGSKSYQLSFGRGYVRIERPSVVKFLDQVLTEGYVGWGYMERINQAKRTGLITEKEYEKILVILD